jgi:hypothetical protein
MEKWIKIMSKILEILSMIFPSNEKKIANEENVRSIRVGLETAPQTDEVVEARKNIEKIETLPLNEREEKIEEIKRAQKIAEKESSAKPVATTQKSKESILEKIRKAERK